MPDRRKIIEYSRKFKWLAGEIFKWNPPLLIDWYCFRFARVMGTPSCVKPCTCRSLGRLACQSPPACIKCSRLTWQWPPVPLAVDLVNFSPPPHCRELMCVSFVAKRCDWSPLDGDKGARWRNSATSANHMPSLFGRLFRIFFVSLIDSADVYICVRMPIQVHTLLVALGVCSVYHLSRALAEYLEEPAPFDKSGRREFCETCLGPFSLDTLSPLPECELNIIRTEAVTNCN